MIGSVLPSAGALVAGGLLGWVLVRWTNIAIARLWAIVLFFAALGLFSAGLVRGDEGGIALVVIATFLVCPGLIGSVVAMVLTEWRMREE